MVKFLSLRTAVYFVVDLLISLDQSLHMDEETWFEFWLFEFISTAVTSFNVHFVHDLAARCWFLIT